MNSRSTRQMRRAARAASLVSPQRQRGAAAVFAAVAMLAALAAMLLSINIGMLYYAQRDLQRLATVAASDGVQVANGCRILAGTPGDLNAVTALVTKALKANASPGTDPTQYLTGIGRANGVEVGHADFSTGTYKFVSLNVGHPKIDSVRVNLSRSAPTVIGGSLFTGTPVTLYASSAAWQPAFGSFFVGSGLANLNSNSGTLLGPLLNALFGSSVDVAALNSAGLAQTQVNLAQLMVAANVTDLHSLTNLNTNLTGALNILGQAVSGTAGGLISGLGAQAYSHNGGGQTQNYFGDLFDGIGSQANFAVTDLQALQPTVDAYDLLLALAEDAAKGGPIQLQPSNSFLNLLSLPGGTQLQLFATIIQAPQFALGPALPTTTAQTAQVVLAVRPTVTVPGILSVNLGVDLTVADATGTLTSLQCPTFAGGQASPIATVAVNTQVAQLSVGSFDPTDAKHGEPLGKGQLLSVLSGTATVTLNNKKVGPVNVGSPVNTSTGPYDTYTSQQGTIASNGNTTNPVTYSLPHQTIFTAVAPDNTYTVGSQAILAGTINTLFGNLTANNNLQVCILGLCVGPLVDPILNALNGLLSPLATALDTALQALMQLLGLQLGTGTITMDAVTIGQPVIVATCLPITGPHPPNNACQ